MDEKEIEKLNIKGLTEAEVQKLTKEGKTNALPNSSSKSVSAIIIGNVCTYFNAIFLGLAILVIIAGAYKNLMFLPVVIANMLIGIIQQLRSKKVLDSLSLLDTTEYAAIRDGKVVMTDTEKLVLGEYVLLSAGQQIPADAEVIEGKLSANEALLTGESDEIEKAPGSELMSGSFVVSGSCVARLTKVGSDSYAAQLTAKAKEVKDKKSELIRDIELIILVAGIVIIPVGGGLLYEAMAVNHLPFSEAVPSMVGAVIGMIPEGLYLLLTIALTVSAALLAKKKVLLHDMKSIETLARVDVLCVDKTGTITNDVMSVTAAFAPQGRSESEKNEAEEILGRYVNTVPDANITMVALKAHYGEKEALVAKAITPFSSRLKYSEIRTADRTLRLGAPEFLLSEEQMELCREGIETYTGKGQRVLALVERKGGEEVPEGETLTPILFVSLANEIRKTAPETFSYFKEQGVKIKVISGDNPLTVSRVAMEAKIDGAEKYVDASTLKVEHDYRVAVKEYTVFGRVKPEQKKRLIQAIKTNGEKVAMTGDGVNDILAMKEADCSIAMGGGSDAARQAAQVVLMDSDFSHMMQIVSEGRRIINNMTRSGIMFLYKNIFSLILAVFAIATTLHYPLKANQISLVSAFNIGIPGFFLAFENNTKRQRGRLLTQTLMGAAPAAIAAAVAVAAILLVGRAFGATEDEISVASTYMLSSIGFSMLFRQLRPLNKYRIMIFVVSVGGMVLSVLLLWNAFMNAYVPFGSGLIAFGLAVAGAILAWFVMVLIDWIFDDPKKKDPLSDPSIV
ncbi:MAG: HAD-IC family P-type ATPase [Eubacterium sp.]|nr:HAD-IC family P-type ATPase [Eubacterium sp.]